MSNITVYSSNVGRKQDNDYKTFSDYDRFTGNRLNAKIFKVLSHLYTDTDWSIYVDANTTLNKSPEELVEMVEGDIGVFHHNFRDCLYEEAKVCRKIYDKEQIDEQVARYKAEGFPEHAGLGSCGLLIRKNTPEIARLNEKWWAEICRGSYRDQISFPYVFREINYLPKANHLKPNPYFTIKYGI